MEQIIFEITIFIEYITEKVAQFKMLLMLIYNKKSVLRYKIVFFKYIKVEIKTVNIFL
jgi:hypothetical protein